MSYPAIGTRLIAGALVVMLSSTLAQAVELTGTPVPLGDPGRTSASQVASDPAVSAPQILPAEISPAAPAPVAAAVPPVELPVPPAADDRLTEHSDIALSDEQLDALWEKHIGPELGRALHQLDGPTLSSAIMVPFIVFFFVFGCPTLIVVVLLVLNHRARTRHQQALNTNIDKLLAAGRDIPLELLRGDAPKDAPENDGLRRGIMNIGVGIGLLLFLGFIAGFDVGALGFIPIAMGVSRLIIWKLAQPKSPEQGRQV